MPKRINEFQVPVKLHKGIKSWHLEDFNMKIMVIYFHHIITFSNRSNKYSMLEIFNFSVILKSVM